MRFGFTTGSCAAAAAKAACYMLLTGKKKKSIQIETPKGIPFEAEIVEIHMLEKEVRCGVVKDGGDDPDVTTGSLIMATVSLQQQGICIDGGRGVGRVTMPGLDQPVGNAAINHVPREMIEKEVTEVCTLCDYRGGIKVIISVPGGEELAEKTFNPRLGIQGGISILGTSGIVEPMSSRALLDTIRVELNQKKELGYRLVPVSPGNYGLDFMKNTYDFDLDVSVKCSNFIGDTMDMACELGFEGILLTGHIGKLIKVSGGMMNTHSKEGDCRMELLAAAGLKGGCSKECALEILGNAVTEEGIRLLQEEKVLEPSMAYVMERIHFFLQKRAAGRLQVECMMYANQYGLLGQTPEAEKMLQDIRLEMKSLAERMECV